MEGLAPNGKPKATENQPLELGEPLGLEEIIGSRFLLSCGQFFGHYSVQTMVFRIF